MERLSAHQEVELEDEYTARYILGHEDKPFLLAVNS
jgi:hypothetical protein